MAWLLDGFWPWYVGAPLFALLVVGMWLVERRLLGVSGTYTAMLTPTLAEDRALAAADDAAVAAAFRQATIDAFGQEAFDALEAEQGEAEPAVVLPRERLPRSAHYVFVIMLALGGMVGALVSGGWSATTHLGALHSSYFGGSIAAVLLLAVGGVFVGFGTRMAGGCTTGHGFSGCARLQIGSLVATGSFFGAAVGTAFLLSKVLT
jgi:uncharacterized membrane protein YedE/YeeE